MGGGGDVAGVHEEVTGPDHSALLRFTAPGSFSCSFAMVVLT